MIRRLNFTHRKRINREHLAISLGRTANGSIEFDASIDLSSYDLPPDAHVFIEAYRRTALMRFPAGTVAAIALPEVRELSEFSRPEGIQFRVKVSSPEPDRGKLLAEADRIGFQEPEEINEEQVPLLPVEATELGALVWKLDLTDKPTLLVNEKLGDWREVVRAEAFITLVLPEAFRQVLTRIWVIDKAADVDNTETWHGQWVRFAVQIPGSDSPPDVEDDASIIEQWIDDVVGNFSSRLKMLDRFVDYWAQEEQK